MTGYELRIWRKGFGWDQERAAEELGVSLRTYKTYEKSAEVARVVALAAQLLMFRAALPQIKKASPPELASLLENILNPV